MPRVRLYGPAREAFGARECDVVAVVLEDLVAALAARGGPSFAAVLGRAQVWVNGDPAPEGAVLDEGDEVAIVPPVSGGAG